MSSRKDGLSLTIYDLRFTIHVLCVFVPLWLNELLDRAELLEHPHEIEVIPGFDDLAVRYSHDGDACELHRLLRRSKSEAIPLVTASHSATRRDLVAFGQRILDDHFDLL